MVCFMARNIREPACLSQTLVGSSPSGWSRQRAPPIYRRHSGGGMLRLSRNATVCALLFIASDAAAQIPMTADTIVVESRRLERARRVFVALPASHALTTRSYPVVVILD